MKKKSVFFASRAGSASVLQDRRATGRLSVARVTTLLVALALVLASCSWPWSGASQTDEPAQPEIIVDFRTLPYEVLRTPEGTVAHEVAIVAQDAEEMARQWQLFRFPDEPPDVDFDTQVVLFAGFTESSTCPYRHDDVVIDAAERRVSFIAERAYEVGAACTADGRPRTLGLTIDRSLLPEGVFQVEPPLYDERGGPPPNVTVDPVATSP
jgi:hypothetical protein